MKKQMWRIALTCALALVGGVIALALVGCDVDTIKQAEVQGFRARGTQHTFHSEVVTNTNGTSMWVDSFPTLGIQVVGITNATVSFVGTIDASNWVAVEVVNVSTGAKVTSTTADGIFRLPVGDIRQVRCPISSWVGGTITVKGNAPSEASYALEDPQLAAGGEVVGIVRIQDANEDEIEVGPNGSLAVKQLLLRVDECESITSETVAGSTDVSGIATSTQHRGSGTNSIEFDKTGTSQAYAVISRTISAIDATDWARHSFIDYWIWITDAEQEPIDKVYVGLGTDINNYWYWESDDSDFNDGDWTHISHALGAVSGQVGVGADWEAITFWVLYVTLDNASDTLTNMRIDDITLERSDSVYVRDVDETGFSQTVDVNDISKGTQTNDVVITLDGEQIDVGGATATVTNTTGSGAISVSYAPGSAFWFESLTLHLSAAPSTSENITVTLNAGDGAAYDTVLVKEDLSDLGGGTEDLEYAPPNGPRLYESSDAIDVAWLNSDGRTWGLRITVRLAE